MRSVLVALGCVVGLVACGTEGSGSVPARSPVVVSSTPPPPTESTVVAYWECTAQELEQATAEIASNVTGPRANVSAHLSRCGSADARVDPGLLGALPAPANPRLAPLDVGELTRRAGVLDESMRLSIDDHGSLRVRSPVLAKLKSRLRSMPGRERPIHAPELATRLEMASELAVRLAPLARTFARAHAATQLVHAARTRHVLHGTQQVDEPFLALTSSARRIERVAAGCTALLAVVQAGLANTASSETLHRIARAVRDELKNTIKLTDTTVDAEWRASIERAEKAPLLARALDRLPATPSDWPTLEDIADAADAPGGFGALRDVAAGDESAVPVALSVAFSRVTAPGESASAVRAVMNNDAVLGLYHAKALLMGFPELEALFREAAQKAKIARRDRAQSRELSRL